MLNLSKQIYREHLDSGQKQNLKITKIVLEKVFSNEYVNQQIFESIDIIANSLNLKPKE